MVKKNPPRVGGLISLMYLVIAKIKVHGQR